MSYSAISTNQQMNFLVHLAQLKTLLYSLKMAPRRYKPSPELEHKEISNVVQEIAGLKQIVENEVGC